MECVIETKASMILQSIDGLCGDLQITFEEGTLAAWLCDLLKPHVTKLLVCDPRKNKQVYAPRHRAEWLGKINESGVRRRAEFYYQQLDALRCLRQEVQRDLLAESKKHQPGKGSAGSPRSVRSGRRCCWEFYRPRTGSARSGSYGPMAGSASR